MALSQDAFNQNMANAMVSLAKAQLNTNLRQEQMFKRLQDYKNADLTALDINTINKLIEQLERVRSRL